MLNIKLEDYCIICGQKIDNFSSARQFGFRGKNGDTAASVCGHCDYVNSGFLHWSVTKCLRFVVTKKRFARRDLGYYICAKPVDIDAENWQDMDRCWVEVERVYETRWDCKCEPEGVWQIMFGEINNALP